MIYHKVKTLNSRESFNAVGFDGLLYYPGNIRREVDMTGKVTYVDLYAWGKFAQTVWPNQFEVLPDDGEMLVMGEWVASGFAEFLESL